MYYYNFHYYEEMLSQRVSTLWYSFLNFQTKWKFGSYFPDTIFNNPDTVEKINFVLSLK
jgi:hypothetical protein